MTKTRRRRIILGVILGSILALLALFLIYPAIIIAKFNKDLIRINTIAIDIGEKNIDLGIDIGVRNEAPFHKLLDSISYTVSFDTFQFVSGATRLDSVRGGEQFDSLLLPVTIDRNQLKTAIKSLQHLDSIQLVINFVAHYEWPIIDKVDIPIQIVRRMPPPNPPEVKLANVDVEKFSFNEPVVAITLQLINENSFSLTLKDIHLYIDFEELFKAEVHHPDRIHIKSKDTTMIDVTAQVHELKALKTVWQLLVKRNEVDFNMRVKAKYIDENGEAEPIDINITNSGSVQTKSRKERKESNQKNDKKGKRKV